MASTLQAAASLGLKFTTVNTWIQRGLLDNIPDDGHGNRVWGASEIAILALTVKLRGFGGLSLLAAERLARHALFVALSDVEKPLFVVSSTGACGFVAQDEPLSAILGAGKGAPFMVVDVGAILDEAVVMVGSISGPGDVCH